MMQRRSLQKMFHYYVLIVNRLLKCESTHRAFNNKKAVVGSFNNKKASSLIIVTYRVSM